ncbi:glycosyltransferase family 2 protein [Mucilaginibacter sp.]|uniref:glycosyltransferase family 2 protein n=1 Tax=Mucilaginibacter sp. TaxID=1882438 RepID=UPI003AFFA483
MVSVIIPNYNHAIYLQERIDSVLNQTYQDFEIIILDDKSTDNSKKVIEQYRSHPKVSQIVYNEVNSGTTFKQWNKGIRLAKGELIWFAESDDAAANTFLEELIKPFEQNPKLGIVYCDSYYMDEYGEKLKCTHLWKNERFSTQRWEADYTNLGIDEVNNYLLFHNIIDNASSALFSKRYIVKAGMANEKFRYAGDMLLYIKILMLSDIYYISKPLNYFRDHAINTSKESFGNGLKYYELVLAHALIIKNKLVSQEAKNRSYGAELKNFKDFAYLSLKRNKKISLFLNKQLSLIMANPKFAAKLLSDQFYHKSSII